MEANDIRQLRIIPRLAILWSSRLCFLPRLPVELRLLRSPYRLTRLINYSAVSLNHFSGSYKGSTSMDNATRVMKVIEPDKDLFGEPFNNG